MQCVAVGSMIFRHACSCDYYDMWLFRYWHGSTACVTLLVRRTTPWSCRCSASFIACASACIGDVALSYDAEIFASHLLTSLLYLYLNSKFCSGCWASIFNCLTSPCCIYEDSDSCFWLGFDHPFCTLMFLFAPHEILHREAIHQDSLCLHGKI